MPSLARSKASRASAPSVVALIQQQSNAQSCVTANGTAKTSTTAETTRCFLILKNYCATLLTRQVKPLFFLHMKNVTIDGKIVDLKSVDFDGIDHNDAPDYSDAFIVSAEFEDGTPLIEAQLEMLFDLCGYDLLMDYIH